jgi:hypothetical protein
MYDQTTPTDELLRNAIAGLAMLLTVTIGAFVVSYLL